MQLFVTKDSSQMCQIQWEGIGYVQGILDKKKRDKNPSVHGYKEDVISQFQMQ